MRVALFVTCLVDLHRPTVGFAAIKLLEDAGCTVEVPAAQTCCGQPAYNSGDRLTAQRSFLVLISHCARRTFARLADMLLERVVYGNQRRMLDFTAGRDHFSGLLQGRLRN